jgi:hypothetical protein
VVRIYPLLGNGCVFYAMIRPEIYKEKPTIVVSPVQVICELGKLAIVIDCD